VARYRHGIAAKSIEFILERLEGDLDEGNAGEAGRLLPLARGVDLDSVFERGLDSIIEGIATDHRSRSRRVMRERSERAGYRR
jgi:hypothetical protein